ncbi:unnamed protein product [Polarella glacialis]|uniref:Uncharacterized protein n=1 Tax=Polarella glacialis TaxID=89957 RepID=A0A813H1W5_POLGL|nr:unnamed protein product [Polarella glacialis]
MLLTATQVVPYEATKRKLIAWLEAGELPPKKASEPIWVHVIASLVAGLVTTTVTSPVDVLKTRLMAAAPGGSPWRSVLRELAAEGPSSAWRGWLATYVRIGPQTVLIFIFMEQSLTHFG